MKKKHLTRTQKRLMTAIEKYTRAITRMATPEQIKQFWAGQGQINHEEWLQAERLKRAYAILAPQMPQLGTPEEAMVRMREELMDNG